MFHTSFGLWAVLALAMAPLLPVAGFAQRDNSESDNAVATTGEAAEASAAEDEAEEADVPATPAEQLRALIGEYNAARREYLNAARQAKTAEERQAVVVLARRPGELASRFLALAEEHADDPAALDALVWIAQNASTGANGDKAIGILIDRHVTSEKLEAVCQRLAVSLARSAEKLLRAVLEKNPHRQVKQKACSSLAAVLKNQLALQQRLESANEDMVGRYREAYGTDEVERLQSLDSAKLTAEMEKLYMRVVEEFSDLTSLVTIVRSNQAGPSTDKAVEILIEDYLEDRQLGASLSGLVRSNSPAVERLMRAVFERSGDAQLKGQACFYLGKLIKEQSGLVGQVKGADEARLAQYRGYLGAATLERLRDADVEQMLGEAESLFERVVEEYADTPGARGKTLGDMAEPELFEIRFLSVGKEAPDIEAEDIDGEVFRLSDYRGKVVMLDFWGHW